MGHFGLSQDCPASHCLSPLRQQGDRTDKTLRGVLSAGIILAGLPGTAAWALGVLVGVNMIFGGTAMIAMALHARRGG